MHHFAVQSIQTSSRKQLRAYRAKGCAEAPLALCLLKCDFVRHINCLMQRTHHTSDCLHRIRNRSFRGLPCSVWIAKLMFRHYLFHSKWLAFVSSLSSTSIPRASIKSVSRSRCSAVSDGVRAILSISAAHIHKALPKRISTSKGMLVKVIQRTACSCVTRTRKSPTAV